MVIPGTMGSGRQVHATLVGLGKASIARELFISIMKSFRLLAAWYSQINSRLHVLQPSEIFASFSLFTIMIPFENDRSTKFDAFRFEHNLSASIRGKSVWIK